MHISRLNDGREWVRGMARRILKLRTLHTISPESLAEPGPTSPFSIYKMRISSILYVEFCSRTPCKRCLAGNNQMPLLVRDQLQLVS